MMLALMRVSGMTLLDDRLRVSKAGYCYARPLEPVSAMVRRVAPERDARYRPILQNWKKVETR